MAAYDEGRPKFKRDSIRESLVGQFLDLKFYPKHFENSRRITEKNLQLSGVDVKSNFIGDDEEILIDEKAATSWAFREISTFALELNFLMNGEEIEGWFFPRKGKTLTTHWLFIWPRTSGGDINSVEDIISAEIMLMKTRDLRRWIRRMASKSDTSIQECISYLRKSDSEKEINWCGLRIIISRQLPEQPINILIPKEILMGVNKGRYWKI